MRSNEPRVFALPSAYDVFHAERPIEIYQGRFVIEGFYKEREGFSSRAPEIAEVEGTIFLKCNPDALIHIKAKTVASLDAKNILIGHAEHYKVCVPGYSPTDFSGTVEKLEENRRNGKKIAWDGQLQRLCTTGESFVYSVDFCLPNIRPHSFSRGTRFLNEDRELYPGSLQCNLDEGWVLTITPARRNGQGLDVGQKVEELKGVLVTHIGRLEKQNGEAFKVDDRVEKVLTSVRYCFSFASGRYVQPMLLVGREKNGDVVWRKTESLIIDSYKTSGNWSSMLGFSYDGDGDWARLLNCWLKEHSNPKVRTALNWYLRACRSNFPEEIIVLAHIGLESLGWQRNMDKARKWLPALLEEMSVPKTEPPILENLKKFRKAELSSARGKYKELLESTPLFFVGLRNFIVHREEISLNNPSEVPNQVATDTAHLGIYYLELAMLYALGYKGQFYNWLRSDGIWQDESVPWA